jgi:hypothetical protein
MTGAMLTHSDDPIAAAAFTDTGVYGWWFDVMQGHAGRDFHFGSSGFGPGLASWLELSPTFNLARVQAPLLIRNAEGLGGSWDWYAGLRSLAKPVELWSLPTGTHDVYQASQRIRMNQLLVDWFCFWLVGKERTESGAYAGETEELLAEQYARWHMLQALRDAEMKAGRPPLYNWVATAREAPIVNSSAAQ